MLKLVTKRCKGCGICVNFCPKKVLEVTEVGKCAIIKDKDRSIWWYNGELITFKSQNTINLLDALNENGKITVRDLADKLGINKSAVQKQLKTLQDKGYIIRVGGRSGYWKVIIICTTPDSGTK